MKLEGRRPQAKTIIGWTNNETQVTKIKGQGKGGKVGTGIQVQKDTWKQGCQKNLN